MPLPQPLAFVHRMYRRLRFGPPIVVVSGLPRSGTSMAMKMLVAGGLGAVSDGLRTADEDNPEGYFEEERVKDLHQMANKVWLRDARGKAIKVISFLLQHLPTDNNYKVLFLHRHLDEVLASQAKMLTRRGEAAETDDARMREVYTSHLWRVGYLLKHAPHLESIDLEYTEVLKNPRQAAERIRNFLALDLDVERMAAVVNEALYRNRR